MIDFAGLRVGSNREGFPIRMWCVAAVDTAQGNRCRPIVHIHFNLPASFQLHLPHERHCASNTGKAWRGKFLHLAWYTEQARRSKFENRNSETPRIRSSKSAGVYHRGPATAGKHGERQRGTETAGRSVREACI